MCFFNAVLEESLEKTKKIKYNSNHHNPTSQIKYAS